MVTHSLFFFVFIYLFIFLDIIRYYASIKTEFKWLLPILHFLFTDSTKHAFSTNFLVLLSHIKCSLNGVFFLALIMQ